MTKDQKMHSATGLGPLEAAAMLHTFHVNSVGPLMITESFLDLLGRDDEPKVINVTSKMGSLASKQSGGDYSYCSSKAVLDMLTRALAFDLRSKGVLAVAVQAGRFFHREGQELPW